MFSKLFGVPEIKPDELFNKLQSNEKVIVLDVRTENEWRETGIIPGSVLIPTYQIDTELSRGRNFDKGKPIVVVCRSGRRSMVVARKFKKMGLEVYNLKGGIKNWLKHQYQIEQIE